MLQELAAFLSSDDYQVVIRPDEPSADWWAGAPSVVRTADGSYYMAVRMREAVSPRGIRGYEVRLLRSEDGMEYQPIMSLKREEFQTSGFERPALAYDPRDDTVRLYVCSSCFDNLWGVLAFEKTADLTDLDKQSIRPVLPPKRPEHPNSLTVGYKDPFVFFTQRCWHMYIVGYDSNKNQYNTERVHHFTSSDGLAWDSDPRNPVFDNGGWHNFYTRPACLFPAPVGWFLVYEGSNSNWYDPSYNIATGLAYTSDLETFIDLSPEKPLVTTATPGDYHTWRYSHWRVEDGRLLIYAEAACPDNTFETRVYRWPLETTP